MNRVCIARLFIFVILFSSCSKKEIKHEPRPIPVEIGEVIIKTVPYYISTVGHIEAFTIVNIKAQATGYLMNTYFQEGDDLKKGDLMYLIDQRPYIAALDLAEAILEENKANLGLAERTAARNTLLAKDDYVSKQVYDQYVTTVQADQAIIKENQASVDTAKINLGFTEIRAPIDARAGEWLVNNGNFILEAAETTLVTLNQITPIYATFFITGKDFPKVQRYQKKNGVLKTIITREDPESPPFEGMLTFTDNQIDLSTGLLRAKSTIPNEDKALWPNEYVHVDLILDMLENATLVPSSAMQESPIGKFVYVVKKDNTVEMRKVIAGQKHNDLILIKKGVNPGEKIVTSGQINLYQGALVESKKKEKEA